MLSKREEKRASITPESCYGAPEQEPLLLGLGPSPSASRQPAPGSRQLPLGCRPGRAGAAHGLGDAEPGSGAISRAAALSSVLQRPGASSPRRKPDPPLRKGPGNLLVSFLPPSQSQACPHASFTSVLF